MKKFILFALLVLIPSISFAVSGYPNKGKVINQTLTSSGVEYAVTLPNGTGGVSLQSRTAADFKLAFTSNESGTNYFTVKSGTVYNSPTLGLSSQAGATLNTTIFLQSASAGQVVEILVWQ